ncbi:MAG: amidohydrolase [Psychrosphaera sp.]|nr:amidohydrolase [Psychrosphaera sp.]
MATNTQWTTFRKALHTHPELSNQETATAQSVLTQFDNLNPDEIHQGLGGTGLAFVYNGQKPGPTTLIRCELDALPIQESNTFAHRSQNNGVSHKCGHDGHMAIVTAVGEKLKYAKVNSGRVILLFQPAEETGAGAVQVIEDKKFKPLKPDYAFALHNLPGQPLGEVFVKPGSFNCASRGMTVKLSGKTSHAAHPEDGISPATAVSYIIDQLPKMKEQINEFSLVTVVGAILGAIDESGQAPFGTSPGEATVMATLRTASNDAMQMLVASTVDMIEQCAKSQGLSVEFGWHDGFYACSNTQAGYEKVVEACRNLNVDCTTLIEAYRWSEDFGKLRDTAKEGAMFTLGAGIESPQLHNPDYDFPDALINTGRDIFVEIIRLNNGLG